MFNQRQKTIAHATTKRTLQKSLGYPYFAMPDEANLMTENHRSALTQDKSKRGTPTFRLHYETTPPNHFPFDAYEAYRIRLTSLCNGALYALNQDTLLLIQTKRMNSAINKIQTQKHLAICALHNKKLVELDRFKKQTLGQRVTFSTELYEFFQHELPHASGFKPKQILLGEAFFVWQKIVRPIRNTEHHRTLNGQEKLIILQRETPRHSDLCLKQKEGLLHIHGTYAKQPDWFRALDTWAQFALCQIIPTQLTGDWSRFQKPRPAILRHIPGEANASTHTLHIQHRRADGTQTTLIQHKAIRQGAPTSFNMNHPVERQESATYNLQQMLDNTLSQAKTDFQQAWELSADTTLSCPILLSSLVTPTEQAKWTGQFIDATNLSGEDNNTRMARDKERAYQHYLKQNPDNTVTFFNLDIAVNSLRKGYVPVNANFIQFAKTLHDNLSQTLPLTEEKHNKLKLLQCAINALSDLQTQTHLIPGRNLNLYTAALYDVTTRLMYGLSTGNCKSSKDRKGVVFMVADAMLIYLAEKQAQNEPLRLPRYTDQDFERTHFIRLFCELYATGHQLLIAHDNSPGCPGIKDEGILDKDMIAGLQHKQGLYKQSKEIADYNKPGTFWKKHGKMIKQSSLMIALGISTLITITLMASGLLSPIGLIGSALALKLGAGAAIVGGLTQLTVSLACTYTAITLCAKTKDALDAEKEAKMRFQSQVTRLQQSSRLTAAQNPQHSTPLMHTSMKIHSSDYSSDSDNDIQPEPARDDDATPEKIGQDQHPETIALLNTITSTKPSPMR